MLCKLQLNNFEHLKVVKYHLKSSNLLYMSVINMSNLSLQRH